MSLLQLVLSNILAQLLHETINAYLTSTNSGLLTQKILELKDHEEKSRPGTNVEDFAKTGWMQMLQPPYVH
jgi:hypothetical protein